MSKSSSSLLLVAALVGISLSIGCGGRSTSPAPTGVDSAAAMPAGSRDAFYLIAGVDASTSARNSLPAYGSVLRKLAARMTAPGDQMSVLRIDNECREVSGPRPPRGSLNFLKELARTARPLPSQNGTYHAVFMDRAASLAEGSSLPVVILLLTDGVNDDFSPEAISSMRASATRLAGNPGFSRVIWAGVNPGWRERIRSEMQTEVGSDRLGFESLADIRMEVVQP